MVVACMLVAKAFLRFYSKHFQLVPIVARTVWGLMLLHSYFSSSLTVNVPCVSVVYMS